MKDEWKDLTDRGIKIIVLDTPLLDTSKYDDELMGKFAFDVELNVLSFVVENEKKYKTTSSGRHRCCKDKRCQIRKTSYEISR